jgi:hypothetical protein
VVRATFRLGVQLAAACLFFAAAQPSGAAVSVDSSTSASSDSVTALDFPHTIGAGSDRALIVAVFTRGTPSPNTAASVTYAGMSLFTVFTALTTTTAANNAQVQFFAIANPPTGTANVTVSFSIAASVVAGSVSFFGVDQSTPAEMGGAITNDDMLDIFAADAGDMILDALAAASSMGPVAPTGGQTAQYNTQEGTTATDVLGAGSTTLGTGAMIDVSWSLTATVPQYVLAAIVVNAATDPTPIDTPTATHTGTPTATATSTGTATGTATQTETGTATATATSTATATATATSTATQTATATATDTATATATATALRPDGATCSSPSQCLSTFCVDGVCCNSACDLANQSCNQPGNAGVCVDIIPAPAPAASHRALALGIVALMLLAHFRLRRARAARRR